MRGKSRGQLPDITATVTMTDSPSREVGMTEPYQAGPGEDPAPQRAQDPYLPPTPQRAQERYLPPAPFPAPAGDFAPAPYQAPPAHLDAPYQAPPAHLDAPYQAPAAPMDAMFRAPQEPLAPAQPPVAEAPPADLYRAS